MRKTIIFGILAFIISCGTQKEAKSDLVTDLPNEFYQRWKLDYGTLNGGKVSGYPPSPEQDYQFNKDKTYISFSTMNKDMIGTWEYNIDNKCVYTRREDGEINAIIKDIRPNRFTLIPPKKSVENTPLTNLTFYYIPKTN